MSGGAESGPIEKVRSSRASSLVVIPAFNEAASLASLIEALLESEADIEVAVVDEGSRDQSSAVARRCGAHVIRHPFNLGYGAALQTGYKYALRSGAEFLLQMDADGQHLPSEVPGLLDLVRSGACDLAIGSRFLEPSGYQMSGLQSLGRRLFAGLARLGGLRITDPTSGFQAMNRRVLELFVSDWYPYDYPDVDVLLLAHRRGLRIRERPVQMAPSWRESTLHSGFAPIYYSYKMLLALWAVSGVPRADGGKTGGDEP